MGILFSRSTMIGEVGGIRQTGNDLIEDLEARGGEGSFLRQKAKGKMQNVKIDLGS